MARKLYYEYIIYTINFTLIVKSKGTNNIVFQFHGSFHRDITIFTKIVTILRPRTIKTNIEFLKKKEEKILRFFPPSFYLHIPMFFSKFKCERNIVTNWYYIQFRTSSFFFDVPIFFFYLLLFHRSKHTCKFAKLLIASRLLCHVKIRG